jgi:hypothetical protein
MWPARWSPVCILKLDGNGQFKAPEGMPSATLAALPTGSDRY